MIKFGITAKLNKNEREVPSLSTDSKAKCKIIAVIEFESHPQFIEFLSVFFAGEEVNYYFSYVFFKQKIEKQYGLEGNIYIQDPEESLVDFVGNHISAMNKMDLVIIATGNKSAKVFANFKSDLNKNLLVVVHNTNAWFSLNVPFAFRSFFKNSTGNINTGRLKYIKSKLLIRFLEATKKSYDVYRNYARLQLLLSKAQYLNVFHPGMAEEMEIRCKTRGIDCITTNIPYRYPISSYDNNLKEKSYLNIVLLGSVRPSARDYIGLLKALNNFEFTGKKKVKFVLLGAFRDERYQEKIEDLISKIDRKQISFKTFPGQRWLSQIDIDKNMDDADFILSPIIKESTDRHTREIYGVTRSSGIDFDAFYYGKPLFVPGWFKPIDYLEDMYELYNSYIHLNELINAYMDHRVLVSKTKLVKNIIISKSLEEIRSNFYEKVFYGQKY